MTFNVKRLRTHKNSKIFFWMENSNPIYKRSVFLKNASAEPYIQQIIIDCLVEIDCVGCIWALGLT